MELRPGPFNPTPVLFRRGMAAANSARRVASGEKLVMANPRAREVDDCVIAILLCHAAVETAWHWEQLQANVKPRRWPDEFQKGMTLVAGAYGRPEKPLDADLSEELLDLSAWRNFLQHGDERARKRLEDRHGPFRPEALNAGLAATVVETSRNLGNYIAEVSGTQRLFDTNWIDPLAD